MNLDTTPASLDLSRDSACADTPVSHGHPPDKALRIILADDHPVVLTGIEMLLSGTEFSIIAKAQSADELIHHLERTPCDLIISDYSMPDGRFPDGLALMGYVKRHFADCPLIVMTMLHNPPLLKKLLNTGVNGLFYKRSPLGDLKRAVSSVLNGRQYLCAAFARMLKEQSLAVSESTAGLSERELEVVRLFVQGLSGRQIAAQLNRSEKTISRQKRTAMDKLGLGHGGGLVEFARVSGLNG